MSTNKRRKIETSPKKPQLSAFAARQALKSKTGSPASTDTPNRASDSTCTTASNTLKASSLEVASAHITVEKPGFRNDLNNGFTDSINLDAEEGSQSTSSLESRVASPEVMLEEKPSISMSTYKPSKSNIKDIGGGTLRLKLEPNERLSIVGQYELCVQKGQVTFMGSTLRPSDAFHRVFAASSHALPVIRCQGNEVSAAEILLRVCSSGLELLETLSPLFGRLWHKDGGPLGAEYSDLLPKFNKSTFRILFSTQLDLQSGYLQPLILPPEWNQLISKLSEPAEKKRVIMICGPKSSGKSTFAKILGNRLLSMPAKATRPKDDIAVLDLDPGQPEYSPPGQIALVHVREPNFGPPFAHPVPAGRSSIIRSHSVASITPSSDPALYLSCALDLVSHYRQTRSAVRECPLIINTPGWVFGTGLEILVDLIARVRPTEVIYMSQDGPHEVVSTLRECCARGRRPASASSSFFTLPSQASEYTTRTAAHLRTMQAMSYLHLAAAPPEQPPNEQLLAWKGQPLTAVPPWVVRYAGVKPGILGVMCYGEQPPPELLADAINGTLVAVVVMDDEAAVLPSSPAPSPSSPPRDGRRRCRPSAAAEGDLELHVLEPREEGSFRPPEAPRIVPTPVEQIPYFNPAHARTLDPRHSRAVGLALVRGIDAARRCIHLLTPIAPSVLEAASARGKKTVLVSGKLDTPGWAYTEELHLPIGGQKSASGRAGDAHGDEDSDEEMDVGVEEEEEGGEDGDEAVGGDGNGAPGPQPPPPPCGSGSVRFHDVPWVARLDGSQGRGVGSRVWRVRRDLGRLGEGGD